MHVRVAHLAESSDEGLILRHGKLTPGMSIYSLFQQDSYMHKPIMHTCFLLYLCVTRRSLSSECRWTQSLGGRAFQELSHQPPAPRGSLPEQGGNFVPRIIPKNLGALHRYANTCIALRRVLTSSTVPMNNLGFKVSTAALAAATA